MQVARIGFALALAIAAGAARADVMPGEWQISTTIAVGGQAAALGPFSQSQCVTAGEAGNPSSLVGAAAAGCSFSDQRDDGSTMTFRLSCNGLMPATGEGSVHYGPRHFDGELMLHAKVGSEAVDTHAVIRAQRTGDCAPQR